MDDSFLLLNPGPVPVADEVRSVMADPLVSHRSAEYEVDQERAVEGLRYVFEHSSGDGSRTTSGGRPLVLMGTATMAMEAAVAALIDNDETIVPIVNGKFGRRFRRIAERYASIRPISVDWGESIDVDVVADVLDDDVGMVTMVHNETSTGVLNPVEAVGALVADTDAHFVVDGVTSIGGDVFDIDGWNVDIAITDAQKALAAPPGISAIYLGEGVEAELDSAGTPFYSDLTKYVAKAPDNQTPYTSAVPLVRAMAVAVERIREEGMAARINRHHRQSAAFRAGFEAMGLSIFPTIEEPSAISNTVTAISLPAVAREDPSAFFDAIADRNVSISGGQGHLGGQIFRVSNMGELDDAAIRRGIRVVGEALNQIGGSVSIEEAIEAADSELAG